MVIADVPCLDDVDGSDGCAEASLSFDFTPSGCVSGSLSASLHSSDGGERYGDRCSKSHVNTQVLEKCLSIDPKSLSVVTKSNSTSGNKAVATAGNVNGNNSSSKANSSGSPRASPGPSAGNSCNNSVSTTADDHQATIVPTTSSPSSSNADFESMSRLFVRCNDEPPVEADWSMSSKETDSVQYHVSNDSPICVGTAVH